MSNILNFVKKNQILILAFCGLLSYFPSLFYDFVYDDHYLISSGYINGRVVINLIDFFRPCFISIDIYAPLPFIISYLIIKIFGTSSFAFHFVNVFFYILSSIALYYLLKKIINNDLISFFAVILYIIHPCHIECTAWISGMGYNISAFFFFLSFYYFILAFDENKKINYIYSIIFYILAILSQPIAVTLPAILCLWIYCFRKEKLKEAIIPIFYYIPFLLIYLYLYHQTILTNDRFVTAHYTILEKFSILGFDIFNSFIPINLCPLQYMTNLLYIIPLIIFILFCIYFRHNKLFLFFIGFYILTILPYSNIFFSIVVALSNRYLLISSVSSCVLISYLSFYILEKFKEKNLIKSLSFLFFIIMYFFSFIFYLPVWKNDKTLWTYAYNVDSNNIFVNREYYKVLSNSTDYDETLMIINKIVENNSTYFDFYKLKINILINMNKLDEALDFSYNTKNIFPNEFKVYLYLCNIYILLRDYDQAIKYFYIAEEKCKQNNIYSENELLIATEKIKLDFVLANPDGFIKSLKIISKNFALMNDNGEFSKILEKSDYKSREEICLNCLKKYNNNYSQSLIFLLSCLYMQEKYKDNASEIMKKILNDVDKAKGFVHKGDTNSAENIYLDVIDKNKYLYESYYNLGILYLQTNRKEKAKEMFIKMLNINPNDEQVKQIYNSL